MEWLDGDVYLTRRTRLFVLLRVNDFLSDTGQIYTGPNPTVEHVLPRNPAKGSPWLADFSDDDREEWTHRLANLVLLTQRKNSSAGRKPFGTKKTTYFNKGKVSDFPLTVEVLAASKWTPKVLKKRQKRLLKLFQNQWRL